MTTDAKDKTDTIQRAERLAALKFAVDMSNAEKQAIWTRHATMIVGNTLILNAIKDVGLSSPRFALLNSTGLLLCIVWLAMTWMGWGWFYTSLRQGREILDDDLLNPFSKKYMPHLGQWERDGVYLCAMGVVLIFACIYGMGLAQSK